jgi:hypothetical protein
MMITETEALQEIKDLIESLDCKEFAGAPDVFEHIGSILKDAGLPVRTIEDELWNGNQRD